MHERRSLGSHFLMFIPKTKVILTVNNRDQDPSVIPTRYFTAVTVT